jgi:signal transduction histidine kinase/CheY-like chemotaxis protein
MSSTASAADAPALRLPATILALGVISVILWIGTDRVRSRLLEQDLALIRNAGELRVAVATSHLWLEEYLSGDVEGTLQEVWRNLDRADALTAAMLTGSRRGFLGLGSSHLADPALHSRLERIRSRVTRLRASARQRQEGSLRGADTGIGSPPDVAFDRDFNLLSAEALALQREVETHLESEKGLGRLLFSLLIAGWLALIAVAAAGLWTRERRRHDAEAALRHSEAQLLQAQKMDAVGRLAGGLAHDINNYVNAITAQCELVRMKAEPRVAEKMDLVIATAGKITGLIRRLLAFSRKQPVDPRVVDLNEVVAGLRAMMKRLIGEDLQLDTLPGSGLWPVRVDPAQLEQIVVNLLVNAREASPRGGRVTIETANVALGSEYLKSNPTVKPGEYVLLAVSDTGTGMPPAVRERIFEPFFTTKEGTEARGLGLATVYGIVKQNGGHVAVYSEPGQGTTFRIYLPRSAEPRTAAAPEAAAAPLTGGSEAILLVEDNDQLRDATGGILQALGYRVAAAANGDEALAAFERLDGRVDLVICDVVMPGMSGPEVVQRIRARRGETRVLFISGYTDNVILRHGILEGEYQFLEKPFSAERLAAKIREVLGEKGAVSPARGEGAPTSSPPASSPSSPATAPSARR